ncbi:MAG: peptide deformylase [Alphaproteobacteria bacterium]|nr:peptide deformylase [Alphaproteobacteria bacterium]MDP6515961.1 peptide deformylase [Alphaproteobacteria bacterium]
MALLPIIIAPDPRLKAVCEPVSEVDGTIRKLMDDMLETMYFAPGIGLAAPQVGVPKRVIVVDCARQEEPPAPLRMADPELIRVGDEEVCREEGCLSFPEHFAEVDRRGRIGVRYRDETDSEREIEVEGLLAACIQHEMDHLDGILFVDYLSKIKRGMILRKLGKARRAGDPAERAAAGVP